MLGNLIDSQQLTKSEGRERESISRGGEGKESERSECSSSNKFDRKSISNGDGREANREVFS